MALRCYTVNKKLGKPTSFNLKKKENTNMCPACYINGLLFLIFGAAGASIANNPWVIAISVVLTIAGFWWMWKAYKKNKGKGGFIKNLNNTLIYVLIFAAGFITASYVTHDYFKTKYETKIEELTNANSLPRLCLLRHSDMTPRQNHLTNFLLILQSEHCRPKFDPTQVN